MTSIKSIVICVLLFTSIGLFAWNQHLRKQLDKATTLHPPVPDFSGLTASVASVPIIDTYVDASGVQHVVVDADAQRQIKAGATQVVREVIQPLVDSLARATGNKPRDIEAYTGVQFSAARDSVRFLRRSIDSLRRVTRQYRDKYLTLLVRDPAPADSADPGQFDFDYNADLRFVDYSKQRKFLGIPISPRRYYTDISSSDPRLKIKGVQKFTIQRRVPAFGVRLQAMSTYNFDTRGYGVGIGTRFDAGDRFNMGVNYIYSFMLQDWVPSAYVKYDILQIGR